LYRFEQKTLENNTLTTCFDGKSLASATPQYGQYLRQGSV
jgi:hypothetical protein